MITLVAKNLELNDRIRRFQALSLSFIHSDNLPTKRKVPAAIRNKVSEAAGEKCPLCPNILISTSLKKTPLDDRESTSDHILDLCLGGNNTVENFLILCHECNFAKNTAMQKQLKIKGIKQGSPGHSPWQKEFPSKSDNLTKLLEYIEWSFRIEEPSIETVFPELHGYFMGMRYGELLEPTLSSEKTLQKTTETSVLSDLEKRIQALENTFWKRIMRAIGSFFQRTKAPVGAVEKSSIEKQAPQPQKENPHNLDFTPEEFVRGLLSHKMRDGKELYNNLYGELISEEPKYNLKDHKIKPSSYLEENCSELLVVEKTLHKNGETSSLWISEIENSVNIEASIDVKITTQAERENKPTVTTEDTEPDQTKSFAEIIKMILKQENGPIALNSLGSKFSQILVSEYNSTRNDFLIIEGLSPSFSLTKLINDQLGDEVIFSNENKKVELNRRG